METLDSHLFHYIITHDYHKRHRLVSRSWREWIDESCHTISPAIFTRHPEKVKWSVISQSKKLNEEFMVRFAPHLDWAMISKHQELSEEFMSRFASQLDWRVVCKHQKLSEEFMEMHTDRIHWRVVFYYQEMGEDFLHRNMVRVRLCVCKEVGTKDWNQLVLGAKNVCAN